MAIGIEVTDQVLARQQVQALNVALAATNQELLTANEALHYTNAQLTRTNTDLDTFVYAASHDLKAPIANIEGLLDALRDYLPADGPEPMVPRLLSMMQQAIVRFQRTVGHLTDISRLQQELNEPTEAVVLADVLEGVRLDLASLLENADTQLVIDVDQCPRLRVSAKTLRSIVFNLLSNAVKYRSAERPLLVQVRTCCSAERVLLEVQDNGLGLSELQQSRLFAMFRRLHDHVEGSGVGLYMVRRIVENIGGTITVQSQPGIGSTFTISLARALCAA
jgi:signal transduction histidine kinase